MAEQMLFPAVLDALVRVYEGGNVTEEQKVYVGAVGGLMLAREKYWNERNADEKAAALSEVVAYLLRQVAELNDTVRKLEQHGHSAAGQVLTPLRPSRPGELDYNPTPHFIEKIGQGPPRV